MTDRKGKLSEDKSKWVESEWRSGEAKIWAYQLREAEMTL